MAVGLLVLTLIFLSTRQNLKADVGPVITMNGGSLMRASVSHDDFAQSFESQQQTEWCWAASVSNIFAYYGHPVSQQTIVQTVYGNNGNYPALPIVISRVVNRTWKDDNGVEFRSRLISAYDLASGVNNMSNATIIDELTNNHPLLVANTHHCMVITAVDFIPYTTNIQGGIVFDPWPLSDEVHYLSYPEIIPAYLYGGQCTYIAAVRLTEADGTESVHPQ